MKLKQQRKKFSSQWARLEAYLRRTDSILPCPTPTQHLMFLDLLEILSHQPMPSLSGKSLSQLQNLVKMTAYRSSLNAWLSTSNSMCSPALSAEKAKASDPT